MTASPTPTPVASDDQPIVHLKPRVEPDAMAWRNLRRDAFWQQIPAFADVSAEEFATFKWQEKNAVTSPKRLVERVRDLVSDEFVEDVRKGFAIAPMAVRISPYLLSLIDWSSPYTDPIRRQFLPLGSEHQADHPLLTLDSLHEQGDAPVPGLTHRYPDKALFLALDTCPVYCRFCTRSYAVGLDTEEVEKVSLKASKARWARALRYLRERPDIEDVVISGGDAYRLKPAQIKEIGHALLDIPHIRRFRYATKGLAIMPVRIKPGDPWLEAITEVVDRGRKLHKEVVIHTHFNHPNEATGFSQDMANTFFERGITVRNQSVLQRGVNDDPATMQLLVKRLGWLNIQPYYVYVHDLVRGTEDLRTTVSTALELEKGIRGSTAGFNTPTFVVDALGGGGKRDAHSFEFYNRETGVSVYTAPSVKADQLFMYFDPLRDLSPSVQADWNDPKRRQAMIDSALESARREMS